MSVHLSREELLVLLIEECGEVIQAATKCLRFGFNVDHGLDYGNNWRVLSSEVGDLLGVVDGLGVDGAALVESRATKLQRAAIAKRQYGRKLGGPDAG